MKKKRIIFLIIAIIISNLIIWISLIKGFYLSKKEIIYSFSHIIFEIIIFIFLFFLMIEGYLHIKNNVNKSIKDNLNRYIRILIGLGTFVVHVVVLIYGGY